MSAVLPPKKPSNLRRITLKVFTVIGAITCGVLALTLVTMLFKCAAGDDVPSRTVLELQLDQALVETNAGDPLAEITGREGNTFRSVVEALDKAAEDDRVAGLVAYIGAGYGMAKTQELRDAIARFRAKGKFAYAFAETYGELDSGNRAYYLASAFDEIWVQPGSTVGLTGLLASAQFFRGTLDLLEVEVNGDHRREYKNAFNQFTERRYTDAHKEAATAMIEDFQAQIVAGVAQGRGLSEERVRELVKNGPYTAPEALEHGLIDGLGFRDEVVAKAKERAENGELLYASKYLARVGRPHSSGKHKVAIIYGVGGVSRGPSGVDPLSGSRTMGSDTVAGGFRAAIDDEDVKAIVFRVDSPGGSAVASETIWRETVRARDAGKPVVVSMGDVAGSGGYYVAAYANKIVAEPGTITGSIGVFAGKPNLRKLYNKVGVTVDSVHTSPNATMFSDVHGYDEHEWARLQAFLDQIYGDFKHKVAEGRGLTDEQVEAIAKGRIWSGTRARENGLVDELGGLETAIRLAKEEAGIPADDEITLVTYPKSEGFFAELFGDQGDNSEDYPHNANTQVVTGLERWRPVLQQLEQVGLGPGEPDLLMMTPLELND
jgi:protease-4